MSKPRPNGSESDVRRAGSQRLRLDEDYIKINRRREPPVSQLPQQGAGSARTVTYALVASGRGRSLSLPKPQDAVYSNGIMARLTCSLNRMALKWYSL
ncbi:hypothetical protein VTO42DRAFT_3362 [Malbranchea cinnamomea]